MNLATRCPSCATVFRVGEDQLLSSEGWVRCGRCHGVFNATEVLFDVDSGAPMRLAGTAFGETPDSPAPAPETAAAAAAATMPAVPTGAWADPPPQQVRVATPPPAPLPDDAPFEALLRAPSRVDDERPGAATDIDEPIVITDHVPPPATAATEAPPPSPDAPPATADGAGAGRAPTDAPGAQPAALPVAPVDQAADPAVEAPTAGAVPAAQPTPSFMRQAERGRLARHPAARAGAVVAVVLLALAVPVQMALLWRDSLAAHLPASTPALQALCRLAGCTVQPLRRIDALGVASSGLNRVDGAPLYRLQMVLHNRADTPVMTPAAELTLTDAQGQLLSRRVLTGGELGIAQPALQAGQELPIKLLLATGDRRVAGYTLELFYP
jgi:predicted Zn finger-like uncharacterized protein